MVIFDFLLSRIKRMDGAKLERKSQKNFKFRFPSKKKANIFKISRMDMLNLLATMA